ncbi:MAG: hypothetical protein RM021_006285 [Nostoc sp. EkiNYC01]|nr:hypothetical protein [Nostoc sp. EkiNYC01]
MTQSQDLLVVVSIYRDFGSSTNGCFTNEINPFRADFRECLLHRSRTSRDFSSQG